MNQLLYPLAPEAYSGIRSLSVSVDENGHQVPFTCSDLHLAYEPPQPGPRLTVHTLMDGLETSWQGIPSVLAAWHDGDFLLAKQRLAQSFRVLSLPPYRHVELQDCLHQADLLCHNTIAACGTVHTYGERIDWLHVPEPSLAPAWTRALATHDYWSILGQAYQDTGDERYATAFVRQLRSWILENPHSSAQPSFSGSPWSMDLVVHRMLHSWPQALSIFQHSPSLDDSSVILLLQSICEHVFLLEDEAHRHSIPSPRVLLALCQLSHLLPLMRFSPIWKSLSTSLLAKHHGIFVTPLSEPYQVSHSPTSLVLGALQLTCPQDSACLSHLQQLQTSTGFSHLFPGTEHHA